MAVFTKSLPGSNPCGGGDVRVGAPGAGAALCEPCTSQGSVRPRFFAGQLLTEEDLQALIDYVLEKNRLHNRHFFGEGVVCGLEVVPHPCDDQKVIVEPGHALDCCGNDVVVPCEKEVEIIALIRELRIRRRGGYDCGDPCREPKDPKADGPAPADGSPPDPTQVYDLYIRYQECQTELISPYDVGEPCRQVECEASRIREGYCFELRCAPENPGNGAGLLGKLQECLGRMPRHQQHAAEILHAMATLETADYVLAQARSLRTSLGEEPIAPKKLEDALGRLRTAPHQAGVKETAGIAHEVLTTAFRVAYVPDGGKANENVKGLLAATHKLLSETLKYLQESNVAIPEFGPTLDLMTRRNGLLFKAIDKGEPANDFDGKARITGDLVDAAMVRTVLVRIGTIKDDLYTLAASGAIHPSFKLHGLAAVAFPAAGALSLGDREAVQRLRDWVEAVAGALESVFKQCFCDALLPPCPPCDDPAVPLARIDVQGCEVVNICNLRRQFIVTPVALSYWLGGFAPLMNVLRGACRPSKQAEVAAAGQAKDRREQRVEERKQAPQAIVDLATTFDSPEKWKKVGLDLDLISPAAVAVISPTKEVIDISEPVRTRAVHLALFQMAGLPESDLRRALSLAHATAGSSAVKLKPSEPRREAARGPGPRVSEGEPAAGAENSSGPAANTTAEKAPLPPAPRAAAPRNKTPKKKTTRGEARRRATPKKTVKKPTKKSTRKRG